MAISLVGSPTSANTTSGNVTLTLPTGLAQDDVVYALFAIGDIAGGGTSSTGWTQIGSTVTNSVRTQVWRKVMGASPDASITFLGTSFTGAVALGLAYRGVDTTTPEDATPTTATFSAAAPDSPSITTVTDGARVISFGANFIIDTAVTAPAGYANSISNQGNGTSTADVTAGAADKTVSPAGAENPAAWTGWTAANGVAWTFAVRPATAVPFSSGGQSLGTPLAPKPVPQYFYNAVKLTLLGQDKFFGAPGQGPTYAYPNPLRPLQPNASLTWTQSLAHILPVPIAPPFVQTQWPTPRPFTSSDLRAAFAPLNLNLLTPVMPPGKQAASPLVIPAQRQSLSTWAANLLQTTLQPLPIGQSSIGQPSTRPAPQPGWTTSALLQTTLQPLPIGQSSLAQPAALNAPQPSWTPAALLQTTLQPLPPGSALFAQPNAQAIPQPVWQSTNLVIQTQAAIPFNNFAWVVPTSPRRIDSGFSFSLLSNTLFVPPVVPPPAARLSVYGAWTVRVKTDTPTLNVIPAVLTAYSKLPAFGPWEIKVITESPVLRVTSSTAASANSTLPTLPLQVMASESLPIKVRQRFYTP